MANHNNWTPHQRTALILLCLFVGGGGAALVHQLGLFDGSTTSGLVIFGILIFTLWIAEAMIDGWSPDFAKWVSTKIIAPLIVGVIGGVITFMVTGEFAMGGGAGILGAIITFFFVGNSD